MVAWYKHDIPDWMDGTESLSDGAYRAYHVICQLIYLHEGDITLNEHGIAGRCKQSIRAFKTNLQELLDAKKLTLVNGCLRNSRAESELEKVGENRENARTGGENSGKSRRNRNASDKPLKNKEAGEAALPEKRTDKTRLDETRPEETLASQSAPRRWTRSDLDRLEEGCRAAACLQNDPNPNLSVMAPIIGLVEAGFDPETQIYPSIATSMRKAKGGFVPRGWGYFVPAIQEAHGQRQQAASVPAQQQISQEEKWRNMWNCWKNGKTWIMSWGPPPDMPGCEIPPDVLAKFEAEAA